MRRMSPFFLSHTHSSISTTLKEPYRHKERRKKSDIFYDTILRRRCCFSICHVKKREREKKGKYLLYLTRVPTTTTTICHGNDDYERERKKFLHICSIEKINFQLIIQHESALSTYTYLFFLLYYFILTINKREEKKIEIVGNTTLFSLLQLPFLLKTSLII